MITKQEKMKNEIKTINLDIKIPRNLKTTPLSRFFIYFPNTNNFELTNGKNFENGFYSISKKEMKTTQIIQKSLTNKFQFLLVYKNISETEIVSNIYYENNKLIPAPFISANYDTINENEIDININTMNNKKDIKFEIEGIPTSASLIGAKHIDDNLWIPTNNNKLRLILSQNNDIEIIKLNIIAYDIHTPKYKSNFNLIIKVKNSNTNYNKKYREIIINPQKLLDDEKLKYDKYILSITNVPNDVCIHDAIHLENKWIIENKSHTHLVIRNFNTQNDIIKLTLNYILINNKPNKIETYSKTIKCTFANNEIKIKNFTKCALCKNHAKCKIFDNFMNYIGNSTLLKHIINK